MKKFALVCFCTILGISSFFQQAFAGRSAFSFTVTQKMLTQKTDPKDFTTSFYGLVVANEQLDADYEVRMSGLIFTPDLYQKYKAVLKDRAQSQAGAGCIDYRVFTGGQDVFNGFWLGKVITQNERASIPIFLEMNDPKAPAKTPNITLNLINTELGWKVDDIAYSNTNTTLRAQLQACVTKG